MKKIALLLLFFAPIMLSAQAKMPTIMVVPSDLWCNQNGFVTEFESFGVTESIPDYAKALATNSDLSLAVSKIGELMSNRGFPLKDLASTLKLIKTASAEQTVMSQEDGGIAESPLDMLRSTAKADIWLYITWTINDVGGGKRSLSFNMQAIDSYSSKQIAAVSGTGNPQTNVRELAVLIEEAILTRIDEFGYQLKNHFERLYKVGREVTLECRITGNSELTFDSEVGDDILSFIIEDWVAANTVNADGVVSNEQDRNGLYNISDATSNVMKFEQVQIPMVSENGRSIDTRYWARGLMRELTSKYNLRVTIGMRGLGNAYIIVNGSKM